MQKNWKTNIALFIGSQTISLFGSSLVQYAIGWYITLRTGSGVMLMISIICGFLPTFFTSPFAGVWADRYNRKTLIILSDSLIALCTLALAVLFWAGYDSIWLLFSASVIRALGAGIQTPAMNAFIPQLVPSDQLVRVNAVSGSVNSMVNLLAPMLSGALLAFADLEAIFFIDVVTAAIAIVILLVFLRVPIHEKMESETAGSYFQNLREGIDYIKQHAYIKKFFLYSAGFFICAAPAAFLTPLQVTRTFGEEVWRLTAIEVVFSIGMMLGGITMMRWQGFKNKTFTIALGAALFGICTVTLGLASAFWFYLLMMGVTGLSMPFFNTPYMALLQQKVDTAYMGRVFGVLTMISSTMMPFGMLIFGPAADMVKIEFLLIGTGIVMLLLGFGMFKDQELVRAGE